MEDVVAEAARVGYSSSEVGEVQRLLALPEEKLVELQLKRAVELQDPKRVQNREARLRDLYITKFHRLYEPSAYPRLRSPSEWAAAKTNRRPLGKLAASRSASEARAARMLEHSTKPLHLSLTDLERPDLNRESLQHFKAALAYAGERPDHLPNAQAHALLTAAVRTPELRPELYLQMLKQLNGCESAEATNRYWELLALLLLTSPPGSGCDDFVHAFCLKRAPELIRKQLIAQVHKARYSEGLLSSLPPPEQLPAAARALLGAPSRSTSRFSGQDLITAAMQASSLGAGQHSRDNLARTTTSVRPLHAAAEEGTGVVARTLPPTLHERTPDVT